MFKGYLKRAVKGTARYKAGFQLSRRGYLEFLDSRPAGALRPDYADLWFLYGLVRKHRPRVVLEFGSGCSTVVIAQALADNGGGHITSVDAEKTWAEVTSSTVPEELRAYCDVVYSPVVEEEFAGIPVFRHTDVPELRPDFLYLDGPTLNPRVQAAVDPVVMEDRFQDGFVMVVDGRWANVAFLQDHLKRDYRVRRNLFSASTVFRLKT